MEPAKRYKNVLENRWNTIKDIEYSTTEDRYRDYCWVISQAALQILRPTKRKQNLPYKKVGKYLRYEMMAHNRYRSYQTEGDEERAEKERNIRNIHKRKYEKAKREFYQT